jgi:hypothetical protein
MSSLYYFFSLVYLTLHYFLLLLVTICIIDSVQKSFLCHFILSIGGFLYYSVFCFCFSFAFPGLIFVAFTPCSLPSTPSRGLTSEVNSLPCLIRLGLMVVGVSKGLVRCLLVSIEFFPLNFVACRWLFFGLAGWTLIGIGRFLFVHLRI